jgi:hypothetical protein
MGELASAVSRIDDPLKLRDLLGRAASLARRHELTSVVVGMAAPEGDLVFPELLDFVESALRVDDVVFRMTRERAVLLLADVDPVRAREVVERLVSDFRARFAVARDPELRLGYFEVRPGSGELTVKDVLPTLFRPEQAN